MIPKVSVVIPNWNGIEHLPECFACLSAQTFQDFEILLVDNASGDGSVAWVRDHHPRVRVIGREDNGGFSKAVNAGIAASEAEYVALLNNDTAADSRWLEELVRALDERPDFDFAASLMLLYFSDGRVNSAGDVYLLAQMAGCNRGFGQPEASCTRPGRVLGASAGASIYRRSMFSEVGLFDEDFFLMSEDTDWNLRALIAGKRCLYVPTARVRHKLRASIDQQPSPAMQRLADRNQGIVVGKDFPTVLFPALPAFLLWRTLRRTLLVSPRAWKRIPSLLACTPVRLEAELEGFRLGLRKRRDVWSRRQASTWEILRWLACGWAELGGEPTPARRQARSRQ